MASYAELRKKYATKSTGGTTEKQVQPAKQQTPAPASSAPKVNNNAQIVETARKALEKHQEENAEKWAKQKEEATLSREQLEKAISDTAAALTQRSAAAPTGAQTFKTPTQSAQGYEAAPVVSGPSSPKLQYVTWTEEEKKRKAEGVARTTEEMLEADRKRKAQQVADQTVYDIGIKQISALSDEDKRNLGQYVADRAQYQVNLMQGDQRMPVYENNPIVQKYGSDTVRRWAETYERQQNEKNTQEIAEKTAESMEGKAGIGANILSVGANMFGGLAGTAGRAMEMANRTGQYQTLQENTAGDALNIYAGTVRQETAKKIEGDEGSALRKGLSIGYQGVMSAADSIARAVVGGGGVGTLALAATGSFSQTVGEASRQGATPAQAIILGIGTAAIEAATEKVPLDNMLKAAEGGITGAKAIAKEALRQAAIEAGEEEISLFGNLLLEAAVLREKSSYKQQIGEAIANGATYEEAKTQADKAVWNEALNTAAVSAVAGGFSGGGSAAFGSVFGTGAQTPTQTEQAAEVAPAAAETVTEQVETPAPLTQQQREAKAMEMMAAELMTKKSKADTTQQTSAVAGQQETAGMQIKDNGTDTDVDRAPLTDEGNVPVDGMVPEIKGTGAAKQNFSGKAAYQELLYEGNVQRDREGDVRPMEVPKTDSYGRNVSEFVGNSYGAEVTPDRMASEIENLVQEGALGFDRRSNQDALNDAAKEIEAKGAANVRSQITRAVANGKIKDGDIEKAMLLYASYANQSSKTAQDNASEIFIDLTTMAHMTGRNLQLFGLLRKLTPEGQAMTIKKMVQRNVENMVRSGQVKKGYSTEVDEQLLKEYQEAARENARAVSDEQKQTSSEKMQQIQQAIFAAEAAKMPATFKAKWDAWRYMSMLGNVKTQMRNVLGNAAFVPYKEVKDRVAALAEKLFVPKEQRTKSLTTDLELLKWARSDRENQIVQDALKYSAKIGDDVSSDKFRENMKVFDSRILETVRKNVESVPAAVDMVFKNGYYARSLADFIRARGYNAADIQNGKVSEDVLGEARSYAIQEAMKATFNDANFLSDFLATELRYKGDNPIGKVANTMFEGVMPFRRTPANIVARFEEYSPIGIINTLWKTADHLVTGKTTAASAVDSLASSLTGSAAMALGYCLAKGIAGIKLTGSGTDEDKKRQGHQDYALEFSIDGQEYSYKIDWAAPANLPLFVGANIYQAIENADEDTDISKFTAFLRGLGNAFEPLLSLSCLSGINDLFEGARYAEEGEALYTVASKIATGYFTQGIPALVRQAYQATQEYKQTTFANSDDPTIRDLQKMAANIPFAGSRFQTDKINAWGEKESTDSDWGRVANAFVNPGTLKRIDNSALEQEITRLNSAQTVNVSPPEAPKKVSYTGSDGTKHKDMRLTEEQYTKLATVQGQTAARLLNKIIDSEDYKVLTDDQKAAVISDVYKYAQEQGKKAALPDYYSEAESWIQNTRERDIDVFIQRGAMSLIERAVESTVNSLASGWKVTDAAKKEMDESYDSFDKMSPRVKQKVLDDAEGDALRYLESRNQGVSTESYLEAVESVKELGENPKDADKYGAIANSGLLDKEVDILMKAYMPDNDATEKKYDYMRQEMAYTAKEYAAIYDIYSHESKVGGKGTADRTRERMQDELGLSASAAKELYKLLNGNWKPWEE